ncbi:hypothetical protein LEP1GSC125_3927 [Leptospira mayottensis 200901122]|uniref:Uncharacterized protein n=1 Tax=Leptospira mayottensis 200901122 TaxID=1193010 RepID=A0AA87MS99_9LEPT|nr:hypothetical protein LEP1GSC125_3927 [Leptospira mayottensis 200901122]
MAFYRFKTKSRINKKWSLRGGQKIKRKSFRKKNFELSQKLRCRILNRDKDA